MSSILVYIKTAAFHLTCWGIGIGAVLYIRHLMN
jgi:hypothetical protein